MPARCASFVASAWAWAVAAMKAIRASRTACCIGSLVDAIEHHAVDDRADNHATPHEFADRVGYVAVVSAQPVHPTDNQGVARPEHIEQPLALRADRPAVVPTPETP